MSMNYNWYHRRWGNFSNAKGRKDIIRKAKRRLKHICVRCGKPIEKGQWYVIKQSLVDLGYYVKEYHHYHCLSDVCNCRTSCCGGYSGDRMEKGGKK